MNRLAKLRWLYGLTASVVLVTLASLVGVFALGDEDFITEDHLIETALVILYAVFLGLACSLSKTPRGFNLLPKAGWLMTGASAAMMLIEIWKKPMLGADSWDSETFILMYHVTYSSMIFALATVLVCLLSVVPLAGKGRWTFFSATQTIFALTILAVIRMWNPESPAEQERLEAIASVFAILSAGLALLILLLSPLQKLTGTGKRLSPLNARNVAAIDEQIPLLKAQLAELEKLRAELVGSETPIG